MSLLTKCAFSTHISHAIYCMVVDYNLFKYIDFLYKIDLINKTEYNLIHYGTDDEIQIFFQKDGLSRDLSKLLVNKYKKYIRPILNGFYINRDILEQFNENEILKYELECYINVY